jgi:hypothetical protein
MQIVNVALITFYRLQISRSAHNSRIKTLITEKVKQMLTLS